MNILLVEDEPMIRRGLRVLLERINDIPEFKQPTIHEASGAEEAMHILNQHHFDIVFTDIEMGDLNGLALIKQWHEKSSTTQWVIISGYDDFGYAQQAISYGVKEYLLKPVTKSKMTQTLQRLINIQHKKRNQFVGADEMDAIVRQLKQYIWSLESDKMERFIEQWFRQVHQRELDAPYYVNMLSHILTMLIRHLNDKGSCTLDERLATINSPNHSDANRKFVEVCHSLIASIKQKRKGNEIDPIQVAKEFILEHIDKDITLDMVANRLGLNPSYFSQLFKQETGETFVKYRTRIRINVAKELLLRQDIRIVDIPDKIGSNDHPHFTKTFKKYTGLTPSEYRSKMGIQ